jgi:DNA-binding NarL/FixJ family response regulator
MPPVIPASPLSILLIEPSKELVMKLQVELVSHFHTAINIATVSSLHEGLSQLSTQRTTLILMDLSLPDCSGPEAVFALRRVTPTSAIIAFSSTADESVLLEAIRAGAHEVLPAPPSLQALSYSIRSALIRSGLLTAPAGAPSLTLPTALPKLVHDLNNAMTSINGFTDILLARLPSTDSTRPCAEQIKKSVVRATTLIQALQPRQTELISTQTTPPSTAASAA